MQAIGTITAFDSERKMSKMGKPFTVHYVVVDGVKYEAGYKKPPGIGVGDTVTFDYEVKFGSARITEGTLRQSSGGEVPAAAVPKAAAPAGRGGYGGGVAKEFPVPVNHPDRSIIRQNALAHATKAVCDLRKETSIALDDDAGWDFAAERIISLAYKFEEYASGHREVNALNNPD